MPHSITPESTAASAGNVEMSQTETMKSEPDTQDVPMDDVPSAPTESKSKTNLEALFDDEDSDGEFASSAPVAKEGQSSQPAPMCVSLRRSCSVTLTYVLQ